VLVRYDNLSYYLIIKELYVVYQKGRETKILSIKPEASENTSIP